MKTFQKTLLVTSLMAVTAAASAADPTPPVAANLSLTNNYVWRGISQTAESFALQGGFDYAHASGFYLGFWGSNVNFADVGPTNAYERAHLEADLYGGYKFKAGSVDLDVGLLHYNYPGADSALKYNWTEVYVGAGFGPVSAKLSLTNDYTWDIAGTEDEAATYLEVNYSQELSKGLNLVAHVGKSSGDYFDNAGPALKSYVDYKLGVTFDLGSGFSAGVAYTGTDLKDAAQIKKGAFANDGMLLVSITKTM
jgi:uncharacterized protein (TIGR02001 family)